ncbi:MAG: response regulator [Calothrix sp. MO_167.B42]|nr:response regulator [Calothrix sp. MO_167.B42]
MSAIHIDSHSFLQKIYPLSLLAQLTSRRATGRLRIFTTYTEFWSIYLEAGKLIYASHSKDLFERLEYYLQKLNKNIPNFHNSDWLQAGFIFNNAADKQPPIPTDYSVICYLVKQDYINTTEAAVLIDELAKETLESFLALKLGKYEFSQESSLDGLPKFCRLEIRLLVEHCQKKLTNKQNIYSFNTMDNPVPEFTNNGSPSTQQHLVPPSPKKNFEHPDYNQNSTFNSSIEEHLYTIACIDDSPTILKSIKSFLDENAFFVITINDPVKALMQILRHKPDLILLDVEMPNLDGYELCSLLRRHSIFKNTPIIMVTGRTGFLDKAKAKMVRSSGYLTKPFNQAELLKIVFKHLMIGK